MGDQMKRKEKNPPSCVSCEGGGVVVMPAPWSSRRKIQPSVSRFVRGRGSCIDNLMPAPWWVVSSLSHILRGMGTLVVSDWQGYGKPSGLGGKGNKGRGQGRHLATLEKPLPLTRVSRVWMYYIFMYLY